MTAMSPEFQNLLQELLGGASEAAKRERALRALAFSDMYGRFDDVEPAHFETFKWIFDDTYNSSVDGSDEDDKSISDIDDDSASNPSDSGRDTEHLKDDKPGPRGMEHDHLIKEPFLHWLSSGNGIFHISGKLGSGKSTLMKFLCGHPRTTAELQRWAGTYSIPDKYVVLSMI